MVLRNFEDYIDDATNQQKLWRYVSFAKFAHLIQRQQIFFAQARQMSDPFEGFVPAPKGSDLAREIKMLYTKANSPWSYATLSCWCAQDYESETLWKRYADGTEGIAICTTVERLKACVESSEDRSRFDLIRWGRVRYANPPVPELKAGNTISIETHFFYKRLEFEAEKEYRVLGFARDLEQTQRDKGVAIRIDIGRLLEDVRVSPNASLWFLGLVIELVRSVAPSAKVSRSILEEKPY